MRRKPIVALCITWFQTPHNSYNLLTFHTFYAKIVGKCVRNHKYSTQLSTIRVLQIQGVGHVRPFALRGHPDRENRKTRRGLTSTFAPVVHRWTHWWVLCCRYRHSGQYPPWSVVRASAVNNGLQQPIDGLLRRPKQGSSLAVTAGQCSSVIHSAVSDLYGSRLSASATLHSQLHATAQVASNVVQRSWGVPWLPFALLRLVAGVLFIL